jgi:hypothetical protein
MGVPMLEFLKRRNWWKVGFFLMLAVFEFTRECLVIAMAETPVLTGGTYVTRMDNYVAAEGGWRRVDGRGGLLRSSVFIRCRLDEHRCTEAGYTVKGRRIGPPEFGEFPAQLMDDTVTYINNYPACARYVVRIDLKQRKTFASVERKPLVHDRNCSKTEPKVDLVLASPFESVDPMKAHFVPIFSVLRFLFAH